MSNEDFDFSRRRLLKSSVIVAAAPFVGTLQAFSARQAQAAVPLTPAASPYGPIHPAKDASTGLELLQLPEDFNYKSFSWHGDLMTNDQPVPGGHDGMGVIAVRRGRGGGVEYVLVRNHELGAGQRINANGLYDTVTFANGNAIAGGTTNIYFPQGIGQDVRTEPSLGGTRTNCAGGTTPWGTWLSCEEDVSDDTTAGGRTHGYVFEVTADPAQTTGAPIVDMGRFRHEAVAIDPRTSYVYQTEDNRDCSGYYRYIPTDGRQRPGSLAAGGLLQAAKIKGIHQGDIQVPALGQEHKLEWVDIVDPDLPPQGSDSGPYFQARAAGALCMRRGEGIWYGNGKMYIVDTSAGAAGKGAVWMHDLATDTIQCIFVSSGGVVGNNPDNITVSPRGGVLLCEDGGGVDDEFGFGERLLGLTGAGESYIFAKNNIVFSDVEAANTGKNVSGGDYRNQEFAGACFDPSGHFLFVNTQTPGITFAIWGPWARGSL